MPTLARAVLSAIPGVIAATLLAGILVPTSALGDSAIDASCHQSDVYVNVGGFNPSLERYSLNADGAATLASSAKLSESYGDIALSADGASLYGITFSDGSTLHRINKTTGAVESEVPVTFSDGSHLDGVNALSVSADGELYASADRSDQIAVIDPDTGAARLISSFPATASGEKLTSAGDFLTLEDGTVLGLASAQRGGGYLVHFDFTSGTRTIVGTSPMALGAAQSGGRIYLASAGGELLSLEDVPRTASENPVATTVRARTEAGRPFYGATSSQDSLGCQIPVLDVEKTLTGHADKDESGSVTTGDVLSYRVVGENHGDVALSDVVVSDPLTADAKACDMLDVGESCELLTDYIVTDADAERRSIDNVGTADSDQTTPVSSTVTTAVFPNAPTTALPLSDDESQTETLAQSQTSPDSDAKERAAVIALAETGAAAPIGWTILAAVLLAAGAALRTRGGVLHQRTIE